MSNDQTAGPSEPKSSDIRVLLIDDDLAFRKLVSIRIKSFFEKITFSECDNLTDARKFLEDNEKPYFDLVVLDQHLPDGKGTELLAEGWFDELAVLSVSSDDAPEIPGASITAGATYFLSKKDIGEPLFSPLVKGIIDRNKIQRKLIQTKVDEKVIDLVKTHIGTLQHEINNPLGAVLGAAYLLKNAPGISAEQQEAARLVEQSGNRIKYVLDQICDAMKINSELEQVVKAKHKVFHIPGDEPWDESN